MGSLPPGQRIGRSDGVPTPSAAAAPELGQHTKELLLELGYSWEETTRLNRGPYRLVHPAGGP